MLLDFATCIKSKKHNSKVFTSAFPYKRYCHYCMTPIKEETIMKESNKPIWNWNETCKLICDLEERTTQWVNSTYSGSICKASTAKESIFLDTLRKHIEIRMPKPKIPKEVFDNLIKDIGCSGKEIVTKHLDACD